jgi:hypothetical protein
MRFPLLIHVAVLAAAVAGCSESTTETSLTTSPELTILAPGRLLDGPPPHESLVTPEIVTQGIPFLVTASSFGSSSCTEEAGYESLTSPARAEIRLFDRVAPEGSSCTKDLRSFPRTLIVRFDRAGAAEVVVIGRDGDGRPLEIRRAVVVQDSL